MKKKVKQKNVNTACYWVEKLLFLIKLKKKIKESREMIEILSKKDFEITEQDTDLDYHILP